MRPLAPIRTPYAPAPSALPTLPARPRLSPFSLLAAPGWGLQNKIRVHEDKNKIVLEADIPGMTFKDVKVSMERGLLTIRAAKNESFSDKKKSYREEKHSSMTYQVPVPNNANKKIMPTAEVSNGILKISFLKMATAAPRQRVCSQPTCMTPHPHIPQAQPALRKGVRAKPAPIPHTRPALHSHARPALNPHARPALKKLAKKGK